MKVEFESVLFGCAFLLLALISIPKGGRDGAKPEPASETPSEQSANQPPVANGG